MPPPSPVTGPLLTGVDRKGWQRPMGGEINGYNLGDEEIVTTGDDDDEESTNDDD